jgi:hypothetical protein
LVDFTRLDKITRTIFFLRADPHLLVGIKINIEGATLFWFKDDFKGKVFLPYFSYEFNFSYLSEIRKANLSQKISVVKSLHGPK